MNISIITQTPKKPWLSKYYWKSLIRSAVGKSRGPQVVISSAMRGFAEIGISYSLNPVQETIFAADVVWANESLDALTWAIEMKKKGKIKKLIAGPNLVILPSDHDNIVCSGEIDKYLVVSNWTFDMYAADRPAIADHLEIWPAGVDASFWKPSERLDNKGKVIIYQKNAEIEILKKCRRILIESGYEIIEIRYGKYRRDEYLKKLQSAEFLVYFNDSESQGIALAECWSADVPTFVWNQGTIIINEGKSTQKSFKCSSAPYLSESTGLFFKDEADFAEILKNINNIKLNFQPRQWVLSNMTDKICAEKLIAIINK